MDQTVSDHDSPGAPTAARSSYDADLQAWAVQQSAALRDRRMVDLDLPNLVDEVGGIARYEVLRFERRLERVCHQLMLWDYGEGHRTPARAATIARQRARVSRLLARCPSLEALRADALDHGYEFGRFGALREDERLPEAILPAHNPYTWADAMTRPVAAPGGGGGLVGMGHEVQAPPRRFAEGHHDDVHAWALRQEKALEEQRFDDLDLPNLAGEMAALGNSEDRAFESALLRLLQHLLKWDHQLERRSRSWVLTIRGQRGDVLRALRDSPSLKARRAEAVREAYRRGRNAMLLETQVPDRAVPDVNPYTWDEIMTRPVVWTEP